MSRTLRRDLPSLAFRFVVALVVTFIVVPLLIIVSVSFTPEQFIRFPPGGFSLQWYSAFLTDLRWLIALQNSFFVALGAMVLSTSLGGTLAYALDRYSYPYEGLISSAGIVPILLPPVIIGVAFLSFFFTIGWSGTIWNLIIAHSIFFIPFPFILVTQGLSEFDRRYEEASMSLGATPVRTFRRVTFPVIRSNVFSGAIFVFILSLNEYIVAWLLSGFVIITVPIKIFSSLRYSYSPVIAAVSVVFMVLTVAVMLVVDRWSGGIWE